MIKTKKIGNPLIVKEISYEEFNDLLKNIIPEGYKVWRISQIQNRGLFATHSDFEIIFTVK